MPDKSDEIGALWLRESSGGAKYLSGRLTLGGETAEVVVFRNKHKQEGEKTPDYRVYRSRPREAGDARRPAPVSPQRHGATRPAAISKRQVEMSIRAQRPAGVPFDDPIEI